MSKLLQYLNECFSDCSFHDLHEHFRDEFGVAVKNERNLYLFKYNMLDVQWSHDVTWECRGSILKHENNAWEYVCRPFDKFFNQHEGYCEVFEEKDFNKRCSELSMVEKADGTCIAVWFDKDLDKFRASTLGMITPAQVGDYKNLMFNDLFWETLGVTESEIHNKLDKSKTYIFELCCEENRILTRYPESTIFLLGIRDNKDGYYIDRHTQEKICDDLKGVNITLPFRKPFPDLGIDSLEKAKSFVQEMSKHYNTFGEYPEGFVVYDEFKPVCKMKNSDYLAVHHIVSGDILHTRNVIIDYFFAGTMDDIYDLLTDKMKNFSEELKDKVHSLFNEISDTESYFVNKEFETQKEYALTVQKHVPRMFQGFFYQNKEEIISGEYDTIELFSSWLQDNYKKYLDFWKE